MHWPAWTHSLQHSACCTAEDLGRAGLSPIFRACKGHEANWFPARCLFRGISGAQPAWGLLLWALLQAGGPEGSGPLLGCVGLQNVVPAPPSFLLTGLRGPEGQLGGMPVQGTNGQAHYQLQEAVGCAPGRAARPACLGHGGWRQEVGAQNTTFPEPGGSGPGPRASFGREGRALATPSLAGLGSLLPQAGSRPAPCPALCCRVHTLGNNTHLTCFPESRMARQADSASPVMENRAVGPTRAPLARLPWGLGWETLCTALASWVRSNLSSGSSLEQSG